jgi:hypothetical protein
MTMFTLAYRPFLDPLPLQDLWFVLLIPVAALVSLAYKAVRVQDMKQLARQVVAMTIQVIAGMVLLGALLFVVITYLLPVIAPKPS